MCSTLTRLLRIAPSAGVENSWWLLSLGVKQTTEIWSWQFDTYQPSYRRSLDSLFSRDLLRFRLALSLTGMAQSSMGHAKSRMIAMTKSHPILHDVALMRIAPNKPGVLRNVFMLCRATAKPGGCIAGYTLTNGSPRPSKKVGDCRVTSIRRRRILLSRNRFCCSHSTSEYRNL